MKNILTNDIYAQELKRQLSHLRKKLEEVKNSCHIADIVIEMLESDASDNIKI